MSLNIDGEGSGALTCNPETWRKGRSQAFAKTRVVAVNSLSQPGAVASGWDEAAKLKMSSPLRLWQHKQTKERRWEYGTPDADWFQVPVITREEREEGRRLEKERKKAADTLKTLGCLLVALMVLAFTYSHLNPSQTDAVAAGVTVGVPTVTIPARIAPRGILKPQRAKMRKLRKPTAEYVTGGGVSPY